MCDQVEHPHIDFVSFPLIVTEAAAVVEEITGGRRPAPGPSPNLSPCPIFDPPDLLPDLANLHYSNSIEFFKSINRSRLNINLVLFGKGREIHVYNNFDKSMQKLQQLYNFDNSCAHFTLVWFCNKQLHSNSLATAWQPNSNCIGISYNKDQQSAATHELSS